MFCSGRGATALDQQPQFRHIVHLILGCLPTMPPQQKEAVLHSMPSLVCHSLKQSRIREAGRDQLWPSRRYQDSSLGQPL